MHDSRRLRGIEARWSLGRGLRRSPAAAESGGAQPPRCDGPRPERASISADTTEDDPHASRSSANASSHVETSLGIMLPDEYVRGVAAAVRDGLGRAGAPRPAFR